MRVPIDHTKIKISPIDDFEEYNENIDQMRQQLQYANPTCILISGYRGTGKTSFVCMLQKELSLNDNIVFMHISLNKCEPYSLILRRLIREIYLVFSEKNKYKEVKRKNPKLIKSLELLYIRTFYEVSHFSDYSIKSERSTTIDINMKDFTTLIISSILVILTSLNESFSSVLNLTPVFNIVALGASALFMLFKAISINLKI